MTTTLKAIETEYAGHLFRSRLEARWAVAFDVLGLVWQYEPEGFVLPSGAWYLPDFFLPDVGDNGTWLEVKPYIKGVDDFEMHPKAAEFAEVVTEGELKQRCFQLNGLPPPRRMAPYGHMASPACRGVYKISWIYDNWYDWCICPKTGRVGIEYEARSWRIKPIEGGDRGHNADNFHLWFAWREANSARFGRNYRPRLIATATAKDYACWISP